MINRNLAIAGIVWLALAAPALAQTPAPAPAVKKADTNKDGTVSREERAAAKAAAERRFKAADANNDGGLSREELEKSKSYPSVLKNFDAMDGNKDGKVTPEERRAWGKARRDAKAAAVKK